MAYLIEELLAIEDQASKILKKNNDKDKIFFFFLEMSKKEIESKMNVFFEDEINNHEKKILFRQKKRLREIEFRANELMSYITKKFNNELEKWLDDYFKKLLEDY